MLSSRSQWLPNLEALGRICRPVVIELLGHGRSPSPEDAAAYAPTAYVQQFERLRTLLGAERWLLCGQSLGAALTLRYALDHPDRVIAQVFTNSNSALADRGWAERMRPAMEGLARFLESSGRAAIEKVPLHPGHSRRLPAEAREALTRDAALHDPRGLARTFLYTVLGSPLGERLGENRVPTLLVAGTREGDFKPHRHRAETAMPLLEVIELETGHAVNLENAVGFNDAVGRFFAREIA